MLQININVPRDWHYPCLFSGLGGFVFNPLLNTLFDEYAWRGALLVCSGIVLHGAVAGSLMRPVKENKDNLCDTDQLKTGDYVEETSVNTDQNQSTVAHAQHDIFATESTLNSWPVGTYKKKDLLINFKNPHEITDKNCGSEVIAAENASNYKNSFDDTLSVPTLNEKDSSMHGNGDLKHFQRDNSVLVFERATSDLDTIRDANLASTNNETCKTEAKQKKGLFAWYILKDPRFLLFMVSQFFFAVAYMIPFTYLPEVVISLGYRYV